MGPLRIAARLTGPTGRRETDDLLVDIGATLVVLPRALAERLELPISRHQLVVLADGSEATWPVGEVSLDIDGEQVTTPCFVSPGGPALLGAVALESLFLAVDPLAKRLVRTRGFVV